MAEDYGFGSEAFESERMRYHNGRIIGTAQVMELTLIDDETLLRRAMDDGTLPFLHTGGHPLFHEDDVRDFVRLRWEEARARARQARVALDVRERYRAWQASCAAGKVDLQTCPQCGTVMLVHAPTAADVDDLEYWLGNRYGECAFCGHAAYFSVPEPSSSDMPF